MIVLDASALIDVLTDQPAKTNVLEHLEQQILAPSHQLAEVVSAIARLKRSGALKPSAAKAALSEAADLTQTLVPLDEDLLQRALALDGRLRVLDALYVAVAERFGCPLVTTDGRLARADPPCEVLLIESGADIDR